MSRTEKRKILDHKDWEPVRLADLVDDAQTGFACGERDPKGVVQLRMNNVDTRGHFVWDEFIRVPADADTVARYRLEPQDVLFNNTNSVELVGKSAIFRGYDEPVVYSNHFTRLRTDRTKLVPTFLSAWLNLLWSQGIFSNICHRWIGQSAVKAGRLLAMEIPLPPLAEQRRIAAILNEQMTAVERARKAAEERLEAVRSLFAACLRQALPRSDESLPDGWEWVKLGGVSSIHPGQHIMEADYNYKRIGVGYLTGPSDFGELTAVIAKWTEKPKVFAEPGDVLVTVKGAGVGKANLAPTQKVAIGRQLMAVRAVPNVSMGDFLYFFLVTQLNPLSGRALGATVPGLGREDLEALVLPLPPLAEQKRIVAVLREQVGAVERARELAEKELKTINALPAVLLRRAFSGKLEN